MDVNVTGAQPTPAPSTTGGPNPWESDGIRNAVATLNNDKAAAADKLAAYKAISDLIASTPAQGGAARIAVVTDEGYTRYAAYTNNVGERLNLGATGLRNSEFTYKQLSNFDAMSGDDQEILARLSPFGTVENYRGHLQANADVGRAVEEALATGNFNHISQVKDKRFDALKELVRNGYAASNAWTQKAQAVLSKLAPAQPKDEISLSPDAKALIAPQPTSMSAGSVALRSLQEAAAAREQRNGEEVHGRRNRPFGYEPGHVASKEV